MCVYSLGSVSTFAIERSIMVGADSEHSDMTSVGPLHSHDEDVLEGTEIKEINDPDDNWSDSDSEEEEEDNVVFVTAANAGPSHARFDKGSQHFIRPEVPKPLTEPTDGIAEGTDDDIKALRFSYHRTAFDVDIDELDETPWRLPHTDISDYFNYGFSEVTWRLYCEKQLRHRAAQGDGPSQQQNQPTPVEQSVDTNRVINEHQSAAFLDQLQSSIAPPSSTPPPPPRPPPIGSTDGEESYYSDNSYKRPRY